MPPSPVHQLKLRQGHALQMQGMNDARQGALGKSGGLVQVVQAGSAHGLQGTQHVEPA